MPRKARIDAPGALQHIIIRGIERKEIFRDAKDKNVYLKRFGKVLEEGSTACYAWTLMDNHAHFLLRTGATPIATVMRRVLTGYAQYFNRRYKRHGQLFQNRYKSILCEEDTYLLELVRYIHLNPVRAKMIKSIKTLNKYRFNGHSVLMGAHKREWQDRDYVLRNFAKLETDAINKYLEFVREGFGQGKRPELTGGGLIRSAGGWTAIKKLRAANIRMKGDERILGNSGFVENVLKDANEAFDRRYQNQSVGILPSRLIEKVADYFDIPSESLTTNSKAAAITKARTAFCYLSVRELGFSCAEVARNLHVSPSTVSKAVSRGDAEIDREMLGDILKYVNISRTSP